MTGVLPGAVPRGGGGTILITDILHVAMADVDAARIIYYTAPYRWHESLFTRWLAGVGRPLSAMIEEGLACPVVRSEAEYRRPLGLDDVVEIDLVVERLGRSSMVLRMDGRRREGELAVVVRNTNVWARRDGDGPLRTVPVPDWMQAAAIEPSGGDHPQKAASPPVT